MRILIFVLLLLGASIQAQNVLTCYDYHDFSETDCVGCGLKDSTFSGILLVKNGTIYQPLVKPIKIKTRPNILDMEDGFATRVSIYIDQITTYNTEASVLAFLRACACGVIVDSTLITEGWGINVTEPTANNYVIEADSSQLATTYDLTLKQDLLNGVAPRIPYFTSPTTLGTNPNFWWDNTYNEMVIKDRLFGSSATGQLYVGYLAGDAATSAFHSNFLSDGAGSQATNSKHSNFFGYRAGRFATNAPYSFFVGDSTGMSATNAKHSIFLGYRSGYGATNAKYSLFAGDSTGLGATGAEYANFLGYRAGYGATNAYWSNFIGFESGMSATQAYYSNFIGYKSGSGATYSYGSNFMGYLAGYLSTTSENSNFFGNSAGWMATDAANSNFFGKNAGNGAYGSYNSNFFGQDAGGANAYHSNFFGQYAGNGASAEHSNFLGYRSGFGQYDANYSTLIGYKVGEIFEGNLLGTNNIIIGTNINLPDSSENAMSLGNVLYGTGFKNDIYDADSTQYVSAQGKIGVLTSSPTQQLHVAGNLRVEGAIYDSNNEPGTSGQVLSTTITGTDWVDMAGGDTTQYLNPYIMGPDTVGFYLTIAQDTVLFVATADTTAGTVDIVTGTSPIIITGDATHTPNVTIQNATTSQSGALTSTDWNTFNNKFNLPSLTNGSVLFSNGTTIAQDNANLFWDDTNNELEIKSIPIGSRATGQLYVGVNSGLSATSAIYSNFFGLNAGSGATSASYSNFFGINAGLNATSASYSNFYGFKAGASFSGNSLGSNNIVIGSNISLPNATANSLNIGGVLFGTGLQSSLSGNPKIVATSGGKIGVMTVTPVQTLDITGTTRITGSDGTSTTIMGRDDDGDVSAITASNGITLASNTLKADTSVLATQYDLTTIAPGIDSTYLKSGWGITVDSVGNTYTAKADTSKLATQYDLTQVVGSSKVIDILGSDFTTSATSLQSTALAYTFPSTGTYEIKVYGSYTCSNTANGINVGFIGSGGLVASYITGKHSAFTNNTSSSSTETRKPISAIGTTLSTASVGASSTQYTVMSEALITVSTAGTITLGFASGSGSYSATLQAGSSLIIEKLN